MTGVKRSMMAAAHPTGPVEGEYVDDVFATNIWTGDNGSNRGIVNGCDLDGEGGMVWIKGRTFAASGLNHLLCDTLRPVSGTGAPRLMPNSGGTEAAYGYGLRSFNDDGYSIGFQGDTNSTTTQTYVGWAFRQAPGFFDMVKYTGNGNDQTISHSLGSTPGFALIKGIDTGNANWITWHRSHGNDKYSVLNSASSNGGDLDSSRTVNSTTFQILGDSSHDQGGFDHEGLDGREYMLYLFAHDDESFGLESDESIIQCGTYNGNGSITAGPDITLGWEPQWVMIKNIDDDAGNNSRWIMADNMRGMAVGDEDDPYLAADSANEEYETYDWIHPTATGFKLTAAGVSLNASGDKYIYIAIRRPMKVPEAGTEVHKTVLWTGNATEREITGVGFSPDMVWAKMRGPYGYGPKLTDRLRGFTKWFQPHADTTEYTSNFANPGYHIGKYLDITTGNGGFKIGNDNDINYNTSTVLAYCWKRASQFMDIVCYSGNGVAGATQTHNLGVVPEFMFVKDRSQGDDWHVYAESQGNTKTARLNSNIAFYTNDPWNNTSPTSSVFSLSTSAPNTSGRDYVAYLWATLDGISKVGSYTADGQTTTIDCGFSAGARFVLIKRTDAAGHWYIFNTESGIVSGDDPYFKLTDNDSEITNNDYIDPHNDGFQLSNQASTTINVNTGEYIFLAIA